MVSGYAAGAFSDGYHRCAVWHADREDGCECCRERSWERWDGGEDEEGFGSAPFAAAAACFKLSLGSMAALSEAYGDEGRPRVVSGASSRVPTVVGLGNSRSNRRLAFPVSGPASTYAPAPASVAGRAGRRFVSSSTRPESILDGADTIRHDALPTAAEDEAVLDFASLRTAHTAFLASSRTACCSLRR